MPPVRSEPLKAAGMSRDGHWWKESDTKLTRWTHSGADKEEQARQLNSDQVQGPMPSSSLHAGDQGFGSRREAEAEFTAKYVCFNFDEASGCRLTALDRLVDQRDAKEECKGQESCEVIVIEHGGSNRRLGDYIAWSGLR